MEAKFATIIPIRNMNRALKFYTGKLGGKLLMRGDGDMKDYWASVKVAKSEFWLLTPQKHEKRELSYSVFVVKNIKSTVSGLKKKGVTFQRAEKMSEETKIDGPIAYEKFGAAAFFKDTEGNLLMLWQNAIPFNP